MAQDYGAVAPELRFSDVSLGGDFKCALERSGTMYCWGSAWGTGVAEDSPAIEQCACRSTLTTMCRGTHTDRQR